MLEIRSVSVPGMAVPSSGTQPRKLHFPRQQTTHHNLSTFLIPVTSKPGVGNLPAMFDLAPRFMPACTPACLTCFHFDLCFLLQICLLGLKGISVLCVLSSAVRDKELGLKVTSGFGSMAKTQQNRTGYFGSKRT